MPQTFDVETGSAGAQSAGAQSDDGQSAGAQSDDGQRAGAVSGPIAVAGDGPALKTNGRLDILGSIGALLAAGLIVSLAFLASGVAALLGNDILSSRGRETISSGLEPQMLVGAMAALQFAMAIATLAVASLIAFWRKVAVAETLALRRPRGTWLESYLGASGAVVAGLVTYYLLLALFPYDWRAELRPFFELLHSSAAWALPLVLVIGAPVSEELLFRGYLLGALQRSALGFAGAAAITSAFWTMLHFNYAWQPLIGLFLVGIALAALRRHTGSLWPSILAHAIWNAIAYLGLFTLFDTI